MSYHEYYKWSLQQTREEKERAASKEAEKKDDGKVQADD